jgi:TonB-linked SusC/RagA family outer membrane protein
MFMILFSVLISQLAFSQVQIKGSVTDEHGNPIIGATLVIKGSIIGTVTDINGNYSLEANESDILVCSFVGYLTEEKSITSSTDLIDFSLIPDLIGLEEVVIIGYGSVKKADITSAVSSVKSEDFNQGLVRDASDLIKGKIAGLNISNGSGNPSDTASIMLRGISSLSGNITPLILIDGIEGSLNTVAPENIESIDVLKDASAAAIYGTRGANGVILISTKSGVRNMKPRVTYSSYFSISKFAKKADFMDAAEIRNHLVAGDTLPFEDEGATTNWLDEITRRGWSQNHNFGVIGGSKTNNYAANLSYSDNNGVFNKTNNNKLRASLDVNQYFMKDVLKVNLSLLKGREKQNALFVDYWGSTLSFNPETYRQALIRNPTAPVFDEAGNWAESSRFQYYNPVAMLEETDGLISNDWTKLASNLTFRPIANWETNLLLATRQTKNMTGYSESKQHFSNTLNGKNGVVRNSSYSSVSNDLELTSRYSNVIGEHHFTALAGYSYQYNVIESSSSSNYDFPSDAFSYNNIGVGSALARGKASMGSSKYDNTLIGIFGRLSYNYDSRYSMFASIRREGSSKFGDNYKWGSFPSLSFAWTISNESFMQDITIINNLKLRAGYGVTGVIPSSSYLSKTLYNYKGNFYTGGNWVKGLEPTNNPNPDLRWEKSKEINVGLDFALLEGRINGAVDVYNKTTTDMLWEYDVPKPPYLFETILANVGQMSNRGIEALLQLVPLKNNDMKWSTIFTLSHNSSKLESLSNDLYQIEGNYINTGNCGDPISFPTHRLEVGESLGNFWGLKSVGITDDGIWIIETPEGDQVPLETSMYNDDYKQYLGNGIPKLILGWSNSFHYKKFDLNLVFNGAFGFQILNFQRMFYENPGINYNMLSTAFDKVYGTAVLDYQQTYVSYYIENGDYLKLDNVNLGYTLYPKDNTYFKSIRIYASGQNLFCLTGYKGLDPEIMRTDPLALGNDSRDKYPTTRTYTLGLNVTF